MLGFLAYFTPYVYGLFYKLYSGTMNGQETAQGQYLVEKDKIGMAEEEKEYDPKIPGGPEIGMEFEDIDSAYKFYCDYAHRAGFSVRKNLIKKVKDSEIVKMREFCCSKEGTKRKTVVGSRAITKTGCLAQIDCVLQLNGKYKITSFIRIHNHEFAKSPVKHMLRSRRKITHLQKINAEIAEKTGLSNKQTVDLLSTQVGGREHLGFLGIDYKNYLYAKRRMAMQKGDAGALMEYFQNMKKKDPSFFYSVQLDEDDLIANIFWADSRSIVDYGHFGDVICFDTTFKTNGYDRPFAPFVGINHHKQTIIFGGALLYDETERSFQWVFETFLAAMSNKQPKTIFTDQCQAMANAIKNAFPDSNHRLCVWHIYQNGAKHLSHVFHASQSFAKDFGACVYDYEEEEEWLCAWNDMLKKYELTNNEWLQSMYKVKEKWAMVYGRHMFTADMKSTQRSESMNKVLKMYLHSKYNLLQFFEHYTRLLVDRRYKESEADFKMVQTTPTLLANVEMLKVAAEIYTYEVYKMFENEYTKVWDCTIEKVASNDSKSEYKVTYKRHDHMVRYDYETKLVECSCEKLKFVGILCAHALKVLDKKNIKRLPSEYVLTRWTKQARDVSVKDYRGEGIQGNLEELIGKRFSDLSCHFREVTTLAAEDESMTAYAHDNLGKLLHDLRKMKKQCVGNDVNDNSPIEKIGRGIKSKPTVGRPRATRYKDPLEKSRKRKPQSSKTQGTSMPGNHAQKKTRFSNEKFNMIQENGIENEQKSSCLPTDNLVQDYFPANFPIDEGLETMNDYILNPDKWSQRQTSFMQLLQGSPNNVSYYPITRE